MTLIKKIDQQAIEQAIRSNKKGNWFKLLNGKIPEKDEELRQRLMHLGILTWMRGERLQTLDLKKASLIYAIGERIIPGTGAKNYLELPLTSGTDLFFIRIQQVLNCYWENAKKFLPYSELVEATVGRSLAPDLMIYSNILLREKNPRENSPPPCIEYCLEESVEDSLRRAEKLSTV